MYWSKLVPAMTVGGASKLVCARALFSIPGAKRFRSVTVRTDCFRVCGPTAKDRMQCSVRRSQYIALRTLFWQLCVCSVRRPRLSVFSGRVAMSEAPGASSEDNVPLPGFEGPEKVLEIDFTPGKGPSRGLRDIARAQWDSILTDARCTILATMSNEKMDSYVLSESSLFVYPLKLILKTCGTTTLLMCLPRLLEITGVSAKRA